MKKKMCVVFADAFRYSTFIDIKKNDSFYQYKLLPAVAYSSNLHYQIFQGKTPDEVGFFCDYEYTGPQKTDVWKIKRMLDKIQALNILVRYGASKLSIKIGEANIPFSEEKAFHNTGKYLFKQKGEHFVFDESVELVTEDKYDSNIAFDAAENLIDQGKDKLVVVLNELDHRGHIFGPLSKEYESAANNIYKRSMELFDHFRRLNPNGICILLSDHGMSEVFSTIDVVNKLYANFGLPGKDYYLLVDSVYLRMWFTNQETKEKVKQYLDSISVLSYLNEQIRETYGCSLYKYGELIYRLKEGYVFNPNFFGVTSTTAPAGMHGFMETTDTASGIVYSSVKLSESSCISARLIFDEIKKAMV